MSQNGFREFPKAFPEDGMSMETFCIFLSVKPILSSHAAMALAFEDKENIPNPVSTLSPFLHFSESDEVVFFLNIQETLRAIHFLGQFSNIVIVISFYNSLLFV